MGQAADHNNISPTSDVRSGLVGYSNESQLLVGGVDCRGLIDTGSMITTLADSFYKEHLQHVTPLLPLVDILDIDVAGGYKLPYYGYIATDISFPVKCGIEDARCVVLMLVVPDTSYNKNVPVLVGTNVLRTMKNRVAAEHSSQLPQAWQVAFQWLMDRDGDRTDEVRCNSIQVNPTVYSAKALVIPGDSCAIVPGIVKGLGQKHKFTMVTEECESPLPGSILVAPCVVSSVSTDNTVCIKIQNLASKQVTIPPGSPLCMLHQVKDIIPIDNLSNSRLDASSKEFLEMFDLTEAQKLLTPSDFGTFNQLLLDWKHVFSLGEFDLGRTSLIKHEINLTNDRPIKQRHHKIPPAMFEEVRMHLRDMLDAGIIRESKSPWASPLVVVRKKDNSLRVCIDMRAINNLTIRDAYYMPRMEESMDALAGAEYFSSLDLKSGYWQVELEEAHKERTAFTAGSLGLFECNTMPFGVTNGCATFQRLMEKVMDGLQPSQCLIFLDDLLLHSKTVGEHLERLKNVFQRLSEAGLKLNAKKSQFFRKSVKFLGHIVSSEGLEVDQDKISALKNWPVPKNVRQLRQFLGFSSFYRRYVRDYGKIAKPLSDLLADPPNIKQKVGKWSKRNARKKNKYRRIGWAWKEEQQSAFEEIIRLLCSAPVLAFADYNLPFILHTDASRQGLGAVLYQVQNGVQRVIAYASRGLRAAERNYPAHKLEYLALKWAVTEKFHEYLYGHRFEVRTDNNPLTYVLTSAKLDAAGHRWLAELSTYNFSISYRAGRLNIDADALSRIPGLQEDDPDGRNHVTPEGVEAIIHSHMHQVPFVQSIGIGVGALAATELNISGEMMATPVDVAAIQAKDPCITEVIKWLKKKRQPNLNDLRTAKLETRKLLKEIKSLTLENNILYRNRTVEGKHERQIVLPKASRTEVLTTLHDEMGHMGRERTLDLVRSRFFWPGMVTDIGRYVATCPRCLRRKAGMLPERAPLVSITSTEPMELLCIDYLSLEPSRGFSSVLVITDHFTKFTQAIPTRNQSAKTTAKILFDNFMLHYGVPARIHSDQGRSFDCKVIHELCILLGVEKTRTTPYHPQGNGCTERFNRTLLNMLGTLPEDKRSKWPDHISRIVHAYNCTKHESTGFSPFELMFGRNPRLPIDVLYGIERQKETLTYIQYIEDLRSSLELAFRQATRHLQAAKQKQEHYYNRKVRGTSLQEGDLVLVRKLGTHLFDKLADKWEEPVYKVVRKPYKDLPVFQVRPVDGGRLRTLHRNLLLPIQTRMEDEDVIDHGEPTGRQTTNVVDEHPVDDTDEEQTVVGLLPQQQQPTGLVVDHQGSHTGVISSAEEEDLTVVSDDEMPDVQVVQGSTLPVDETGHQHLDTSEAGITDLDNYVADLEELSVSNTETLDQVGDRTAVSNDGENTSVEGTEEAHVEEQIAPPPLVSTAPKPAPRPAPRRSERIKRKPKWQTSGDWQVSQATVECKPEWVNRGEYLVHFLQACPVDVINKPEILNTVLNFIKP